MKSRLDGPPCRFDVAQQLVAGELSKGAGEELVQATQALHFVVAAMFDAAVERAPGEMTAASSRTISAM